LLYGVVGGNSVRAAYGDIAAMEGDYAQQSQANQTDTMELDIQEGRLTPADLRDMLEKNMAERYGVSRDTTRKALEAVLSEIVDRK
jgi:DNA-binding GntR family transcriptional regulator